MISLATRSLPVSATRAETSGSGSDSCARRDCLAIDKKLPPTANIFEQEPQQRITTLMICGIPCRIAPNDLVEAIHSRGFEGMYDFLYLPVSRRTGNPKITNLGYAFINLLTPKLAVSFMQIFENFRFECSKSSKALTFKPAHLQGRALNEGQFGTRNRSGILIVCRSECPEGVPSSDEVPLQQI